MRLTPNEVGRIPDSWSIRSVGEVSTKITNGFVGVAAPYYSNAGDSVRYLLGTNIRPNRVTSKNVTRISAEFSAKNTKSILAAGDLLTVQSGHIGTTAVVPAEFAGANCHALIITRLDQALAHPGFVCQYLNSSVGQARLRGLHVGSSVPHINTSELAAFKIPLPSLLEQRQIADIADTWDQAIATNERLLANCRMRRDAIASQVLSGRRRLRGFRSSGGTQSTPHGPIPKDWAYPKIEEIASEASQKNSSGALYPVLSCTKHSGLVESLSYFKKQVFSKDLSTYKIVSRAAFAYATNHIEEGSIGYQDLHDFGLVSPMYTVFVTNFRVDDKYLFRLLKTEHFRQIFEAATNSSVDRRGSLRWSDFKRLHVPLPSIEEQRAIVDVLDNADREVSLLQRQLDGLAAEKAALMQQLLTGKRLVRLSQPAEVEPA